MKHEFRFNVDARVRLTEMGAGTIGAFEALHSIDGFENTLSVETPGTIIDRRITRFGFEQYAVRFDTDRPHHAWWTFDDEIELIEEGDSNDA